MACALASDEGLLVNAGHGLNRHNVQAIARIDVVHELNIGHSIVAESVFCGLPSAVAELKALMNQARHR